MSDHLYIVYSSSNLHLLRLVPVQFGLDRPKNPQPNPMFAINSRGTIPRHDSGVVPFPLKNHAAIDTNTLRDEACLIICNHCCVPFSKTISQEPCFGCTAVLVTDSRRAADLLLLAATRWEEELVIQRSNKRMLNMEFNELLNDPIKKMLSC